MPVRRAAGRRASPPSVSSTSMPTTRPRGPTRWASWRIVSPGPQPASRQRAPGAGRPGPGCARWRPPTAGPGGAAARTPAVVRPSAYGVPSAVVAGAVVTVSSQAARREFASRAMLTTEEAGESWSIPRGFARTVDTALDQRPRLSHGPGPVAARQRARSVSGDTCRRCVRVRAGWRSSKARPGSASPACCGRSPRAADELGHARAARLGRSAGAAGGLGRRPTALRAGRGGAGGREWRRSTSAPRDWPDASSTPIRSRRPRPATRCTRRRTG